MKFKFDKKNLPTKELISRRAPDIYSKGFFEIVKMYTPRFRRFKS